MAIRRGPIPADCFTIIDNRWLRDSRLSWKAKGLLAYIASHSAGHVLTMEQIYAEGSDGADAVRSGLVELERIGYLRRIELRDGRGHRTGTDYELRDPPDGKTPSGADLPKDDVSAGQPQTGKSQVGKAGGKKTKPLKEDQEKTTSDADASPNAGQILKSFIDWTAALDEPVTLPRVITARLGKAIKECLDQGIAETTIKLALAEMTRRGKAGWPSMLPSFVVEVQNRPVSAPPAVGQPYRSAAEQNRDRANIERLRCRIADQLVEDRGLSALDALAAVRDLTDQQVLDLMTSSTVMGYSGQNVIDGCEEPEVEGNASRAGQGDSGHGGLV